MTPKPIKQKYSIVTFLPIVLLVIIAIYLNSDSFNTVLQERETIVYSPPIPIEGWSVIKKTIKYPAEYRRAGIDGIAEVKLYIDSIGNVTDVIIKSNSPVFTDTVKYYLQSVKWHPAKRYEIHVVDSVELSIIFDSRKMGERLIIIDGTE
jgi:hypothetical protein